MPGTGLKSRWPWLTLLLLILTLCIYCLVWAQPPDQGRGGPGGGDDPGWGGGPGRDGPGGPGGPARPQFDTRQAVTIKGKIESVGSYGMTGWRVAPGMVVQGLVMETAKGYLEIDLGPPGYLAGKGMQLKKGDTLEVIGFHADREGRKILVAAAVKTPGQTLRLLDTQGFPLWRRGPGGPGPGGTGLDGLEPGGPGPGRF